MHVRAADDNSVGPQGQRPVDVGARAGARAEQDGDLATDRVRDPRQRVDRPRDPGTTAPALVRDHDAVEPPADRHPRVPHVLDAAEHDRPVPGLADRRERRPALPGLWGREQEVGAPRCPRASEQDGVGAAPARPTQAEPPRAIRRGRGDLLERFARARRVDVCELEVRGRPGGRGLAVGVRQGLASDRAEDDRGRHRDAEHVRAEVALGAVDEHARDDPPRSQRRRIRAHGGGATRPGAQMPARALGQHLRRSRLEVGQVGGEDRLLTSGHPSDIDLGLVADVVSSRPDRERGIRGERPADGRRTARGERGRRPDGRGGGRAGHLEKLTTSGLGHVGAPPQRARVRSEGDSLR